MRNKRVVSIILCVLLICFGFGCKNKQNEKTGSDEESYIDYASPEELYDRAENVYIGKLVKTGKEEALPSDNLYISLDFQHITVEVQKVYKGDFKENTLVEDMIQSVYDYVFQSNGTYLFMTRKDYSKDSPLFSINNPYEVVRFGKDNKIETIQIDRGLLFREGDSLPADLDELLSRLEKCRS